jgi:hypothetical protein
MKLGIPYESIIFIEAYETLALAPSLPSSYLLGFGIPTSLVTSFFIFILKLFLSLSLIYRGLVPVPCSFVSPICYAGWIDFLPFSFTLQFALVSLKTEIFSQFFTASKKAIH